MTLQRFAMEALGNNRGFAARLGKHSLHDMNLSRTAQRVVMFTPTVAAVNASSAVGRPRSAPSRAGSDPARDER